jgi:hypothetical protein
VAWKHWAAKRVEQRTLEKLLCASIKKGTISKASFNAKA